MTKRDTDPTGSAGTWKKWLLVLAVLALVFAYFQYGQYVDIQGMAKREADLREYQAEHPWLVYGIAFAAYVVVTGLSLPGAAFMSLLMSWYFGFWRSLVLVSFASTAGATLAFLLSRYLIREAIQSRFRDRLKTFNESLDREGAFYLFSLRLIPAVPFWAINVVMGVTHIRVLTYWWVSQLGMLPGTAVYTYAGSRVPSLQRLADEGVWAVFTVPQLAQILTAFALLGLLPLVVKKLLDARNRP